MILGQDQPSYHDKTSMPLSKPARLVKDHRCPDCRERDMGATSAKYCLTTCPHQHEFTPTPNRFSILAELNQSTAETR
ncbi:unnamed protein product [Alternaria burnsii]|nr:unnamed protein product [Alternaria burnsii]